MKLRAESMSVHLNKSHFIYFGCLEDQIFQLTHEMKSPGPVPACFILSDKCDSINSMLCLVCLVTLTGLELSRILRID